MEQKLEASLGKNFPEVTLSYNAQNNQSLVWFSLLLTPRTTLIDLWK